jgi:hypothetical protein
MMARRIEHRSRDQLSKNSSTLLALEERRAKAPPAVLSLKEVELLNTGSNKIEINSRNNKLNTSNKADNIDKNNNSVAVADPDGDSGGHDQEDTSKTGGKRKRDRELMGEKRKRDSEPLPQGWPEDGYYVCEEDDRCIDVAKRFNIDLERVCCMFLCVCACVWVWVCVCV